MPCAGGDPEERQLWRWAHTQRQLAPQLFAPGRGGPSDSQHMEMDGAFVFLWDQILVTLPGGALLGACVDGPAVHVSPLLGTPEAPRADGHWSTS